MKFLLIFSLITLSIAVSTDEEQKVVTSNSLSLQELLDKVKIITEQLSQETLTEIPLFKTENSHTEDPKPEEKIQPV